MISVSSFKFQVSRLLKILNPMPDIGGLEISDSSVKFVSVKENKSVFLSVNLPQGTIEEGKILDKAKLIDALKELHLKISPKAKKKIYAIINIPEADVYTQTFNLPSAAIDELEGAAKLNLQMISPIDFSSAYSDWQKIGDLNIDGGQIEILGAFILGKVVDDVVDCVKEANFVVAAVENVGLAMSRVVSSAVKTSDFILMHLGAGGLNFIFVKNGNFYFSHFAPWPKGEERQIKLSTVEEMVVSEAQRTLNFVYSRWPDIQVKNIFFASPVLDEKIIQIIDKNFNLPAQKIILPAGLKDINNQWALNDNQLISLTSDWFGVLGSALRGLIPRSKDVLISIASEGTEEEFRQYQIINFSKIWRNVLLSSLSVVLVAFIFVDAFITSISNSLESQLLNLANLASSQDIINLQKEAKEFNGKIDLALEAKKSIYNFSPIIEKIYALASARSVRIDRIFIPSKDSQILLNGGSSDYQAIIDFKGDLEKEPLFKEIDMPLAGVLINSDGGSAFSMTFKIK